MKIITANRLDDGVVVFLSAEGWVTNIADSAVLSAPDAIEAGFVAAARSAQEQVIVDVNAIEVDLDDERRPVPVRLRERIRAFGPTVHYGEAALQRLVA
jgi:Protein of unknown function (DUF2849)